MNFENIANRDIVPDQNIADLASAVILRAINDIKKKALTKEELKNIISWTYDQKNIWWNIIEDFLEYDRERWQKNIRRLAEDKLYEFEVQ